MREIGIEELKQFQLEMLRKIDVFCKEKHIMYFLAYGSLIGSVRHQGYIPWDDDIDLMMPRGDYDRFIHSFGGSVEHLVVCAPELKKDYYAPFANVWDDRTVLDEFTTSHRGMEIGVKIDVFPIDGVPEDEEEYKRLVCKSLKYNSILETKRARMQNFSTPWIRFKHLIKRLIYFPIPYSFIQRRLKCLTKVCPYSEAKYVDILVWPAYPYKRFEKKAVANAITGDFEGHVFSIPKGYGSVLKSIYGDYMQLPPEDKRVPHHGFAAWWKGLTN